MYITGVFVHVFNQSPDRYAYHATSISHGGYCERHRGHTQPTTTGRPYCRATPGRDGLSSLRGLWAVSTRREDTSLMDWNSNLKL